MNDRLPWFRCNPEKLIGACCALPTDAGYLYVMILMRIYERGGPIPDTFLAFGRRLGMNQKRAKAAFDILVSEGKVYLTEAGQIDSASTHEELAWQRDRRGDRAKGGLGSVRARKEKRTVADLIEAAENVTRFPSGEKDKQNQGNGLAAAPVQHKLERTEIEEEVESSPTRCADGSANADVGEAPMTRFPEGWVIGDFEREIAARFGLGPEDADAEFDTFRASSKSKAKRSADWLSAWEAWCSQPYAQQRIGSRDRNRSVRPGGAHGQPSNTGLTGQAARLEELRKLALAEEGIHDDFDAAIPEEPTREPSSGQTSRRDTAAFDREGPGRDREIGWVSGDGREPPAALLRLGANGGHRGRESSNLRRPRTYGHSS